jgi:GT2 family glycosyltransferase
MSSASGHTHPVPKIESRDSIAIVVLTYNRVHLLEKCVQNVLSRTSEATREIVIWDNASTDATPAYLDSLTDPRIRVVRHPENIGQNAYALAFQLTSSDYLVEVDDDIIDAPEGWDTILLNAFHRLPDIGFLAANLVDDPYDTTADVMYRRNANAYSIVQKNGTRLKIGPTGGGCSMTSRELHDLVGGFRQNKDYVFWLEDAAYIKDIEKHGYTAAYLDDLKVRHAGGPHYSEVTPEKEKYWRDYRKRIERKTRVKRLLLTLPFVRRLNSRFGWFVPPASASERR